MKKTGYIVLLGVMLTALSGCGKKTTDIAIKNPTTKDVSTSKSDTGIQEEEPVDTDEESPTVEPWGEDYLSYVAEGDLFGEVDGFLLFDADSDSVPELLMLRKEHQYASVLSWAEDEVFQTELDEFSHTVDGEPGISIDKKNHLIYSRCISEWSTSDAKLFSVESGSVERVTDPVDFALDNAKNYLYEDRIDGTEEGLREAIADWTADEDIYGSKIDESSIDESGLNGSNMGDEINEEEDRASAEDSHDSTSAPVVLKYAISSMDSITPMENGEGYVINGQIQGPTVERSDFVVDDKTVFDENADMQFFGNWNEGDTPLDWYRNNYVMTDTGAWSRELLGVFEVQVTDGHIDRIYGIYWWD